MRTRKQAHDAFISAGFESASPHPFSSFLSLGDLAFCVLVLVAEDLADKGDAVDWFYPLEGDLTKAQTMYDYLTVFRITRLGQWITHTLLWGMEKVGLVPKGTHSVGETMRISAEYLVEGGRQKVCTSCCEAERGEREGGRRRKKERG